MSYITNNINIDGFGSQYQRIIETYIFSKYNNYNFCNTFKQYHSRFREKLDLAPPFLKVDKRI